MAAYLHLFASWHLICTICILHGFLHFTWFYALSFHHFGFLLFLASHFVVYLHYFPFKSTLPQTHLLYCPTYNMPKVLNPTVLIKELGGTQFWSYVSETKHLVCKLCSFSAKMNRKSILEKHMESLWHKNNVRLYIEGEKITQQLLTLTPMNTSSDNIFNIDLVKALVSANVPLHKIDGMKTFLEKYTKTGKSQARFP